MIGNLGEQRRRRGAQALSEYEDAQQRLDEALAAGDVVTATACGVEARDAVRRYAATLPPAEREACFGPAEEASDGAE